MRIAILACLCLALCGGAFADPFIDEVVSVTFGNPRNLSFGDTGRVFGPPVAASGSLGIFGFAGSLDVLNIGSGGEIVVRFRNPVMSNGPGYDFTVFENAFYIDNATGGETFQEPGTVAVSSDGTTFVEFPTDYLVQSPPLTRDACPAHYVGFAGVHAVLSNPENSFDPLDPAVSGGDPFDLEDLVGLPEAVALDFQNIRYVRIRDAGPAPTDSEGDSLPLLSPGGNGFDLDAIAVLNGKLDSNLTSVHPDRWSAYR